MGAFEPYACPDWLGNDTLQPSQKLLCSMQATEGEILSGRECGGGTPEPKQPCRQALIQGALPLSAAPVLSSRESQVGGWWLLAAARLSSPIWSPNLVVSPTFVGLMTYMPAVPFSCSIQTSTCLMCSAAA